MSNLIISDANQVLDLVSANKTYDSTQVFLITRLLYIKGYVYLFLTGENDVQFYFKSACQIYAYKRCFHMRTPCPNKCQSYKNMVVTGLKERECSRINVFKIDRMQCKENDTFLLDDFCWDENRVQMQLNIFEGEYVCFENGVIIDENGCAAGLLKNVKKVPIERVPKKINPIVGCFDLETYTNLNSFSNADNDHIITIAYTLKKQNCTYRYCFINTGGEEFSLDDAINDNDKYLYDKIVVIPSSSEKEMLNSFLKLLFTSNPDEILDYNGDKFDLPFLLKRCAINNIDLNFITRYNLKPSNMKTVNVFSKFGYATVNHYMVYYNHLDVYQYLKNSIDAQKLENLKLNTVANYYLKVGKVELSVREMMNLYKDKKFGQIVRYNVRDTILPIEMFFKCRMADKIYVDGKLLFTVRDNVNSSPWQKTLLALFSRSISNKNENDIPDPYFFNKFDLTKIMNVKSNNTNVYDNDDDEDEEMANETRGEGDKLHSVNFTLLDRPRVPMSQIPSDAIALCNLKDNIKFVGGKVLSPTPGFYDKIFTLDFSQLYTSIMLHFTTCLSNLFYGSDNKLYLQINKNAIMYKSLLEMSENRASYRKEMKKHHPDSFEYQTYDSWQNAAKLVCNSRYGFKGLCCKPLANFITTQGRFKLTEAQKFIADLSDSENIKKKWNLSCFELKVVYGDTDSNFVSAKFIPKEFERMGGDKAFEKLILEDVLGPLNSLWNGAFKMELENIMNGMLIKRKKMYMCLKANGELYKRGFNVKKDIPLFLRRIFDDVGRNLLKMHSLDCVLKRLVDDIKLRVDEFTVANCEEYSFSQTLNESKNGLNDSAVTVAYVLYMQLKNNADTKYVPSSGDRIPYLLVDKPETKLVRDAAKPTQLFKSTDIVNWTKHLGMISSFFNDLMSMLGNDTRFVYALQEICSYMQKDQVYTMLHPHLKKMTYARIKDIMCRELNVKNKKCLKDDSIKQILDTGENKFIHNYEFKMLKSATDYTINMKKFKEACPVCNNTGVAAVRDKPILELVPIPVQKVVKKRKL
uniref:DNA-directed DNA polymerase n=1 Tax=Adoxophyes orana granulovirus TaxID=170617 RepID=A0A0A7UYB3_GVAO|nr:DNA polymerase [Adoxophyes orana granulovirus]